MGVFKAVTASWTAVFGILVGRPALSGVSFVRRRWVARFCNAPHICRKHVIRHSFLEWDFAGSWKESLLVVHLYLFKERFVRSQTCGCLG